MSHSITPVTGATGDFGYRNDRTGKFPWIARDRGGLFIAKDFVHFYDDFLGDVLADEWSGAAGSDAQAVAPAITAAVGGTVRLTSGNTGSGDDNGNIDASSLTLGLNFKASNGGLRFETRLKMVTTVSTAYCFAGFTDTLATTTKEYPFKMNASTLTDTATDAVGFLYDSTATNDVWLLVGTANGTDATTKIATLSGSSIAPTADTFQTLAIEVDTDGTAYFYIGDSHVGTVASAVTTTVALTPAVVAGTNTTAVQSVDVDYIEVTMNR